MTMTKSYSGLAKIGIALLPWLPGALICRFWVQYFTSQLELVDKLGDLNGSAAASTAQDQVDPSSYHHPFAVILIIAGLAFAVGVALLAMAFLRRRRPLHFNQDI